MWTDTTAGALAPTLLDTEADGRIAMNVLRAMKAAMGIAAAAPVLALAVAGGVPAGEYETGGVTLTFADGQYRVAQGKNVAVEGTYTSDATTVTLTDVSGTFACPGDPKPAGKYGWKIAGGALTLTTIADACDDRSKDLTGHAWSKK
jgi:hypothetical protein